jgi:predicted RNA-binding protein with RPS1 domain
MHVVRMKDVAKTPRVDKLFTSDDITVQPLAPGGDYNCNIVNFGIGTRNKFHTHESDQILIVTAGEGIVATEKEQRVVTVGDVIDGTVTKLVPFGSFVQVAPGIEGLIHISELSRRHVDLPEEIVSVNQQIKVKVIDIDVDRRRISLSLKQLEERGADEEFEEQEEEALAQTETAVETDVEAEVVAEVEVEAEVEAEAEAEVVVEVEAEAEVEVEAEVVVEVEAEAEVEVEVAAEVEAEIEVEAEVEVEEPAAEAEPEPEPVEDGSLESIIQDMKAGTTDA